MPTCRSSPPAPDCAALHPPPFLNLNKARRQREWQFAPRSSAPPDCPEWRAGLARLSPHRDPCPGFRLGQWHSVLQAALRFVDEHGQAALQLGWSTLDLWGVHPVVGAVRGDCTGALICGRGITEVLYDRLRFGHLTFTRHPCPGERVPVWDFDRLCHPGKDGLLREGYRS